MHCQSYGVSSQESSAFMKVINTRTRKLKVCLHVLMICYHKKRSEITDRKLSMIPWIHSENVSHLVYFIQFTWTMSTDTTAYFESLMKTITKSIPLYTPLKWCTWNISWCQITKYATYSISHIEIWNIGNPIHKHLTYFCALLTPPILCSKKIWS